MLRPVVGLALCLHLVVTSEGWLQQQLLYNPSVAYRDGKSHIRRVRSNQHSKFFCVPLPDDESKDVSWTNDCSPQTIRFLKWLEDEECEGIDSLCIGTSATRLRGLFSKEGFEPGDYICSIPFTAALLLHDTVVDSTSDDDEKDCIHQACTFLEEFSRDPRWKPYVDCLPQMETSNFDPTPDFWVEGIIQDLEIPRLIDETIRRKKNVAQVAEEKGFDESKLHWATWLVRSRGFTTMKLMSEGRNASPSGIQSRTFLIPFLDMLNHDDAVPNASIEVVESREYEESFFALQAIQPIRPGQHVTILYGTGLETSLDLISKYGFFTRKNPNDRRIDWNLVDACWSTSLEDDVTSLENLEADLELCGTAGKDADRDMLFMLDFRVHLKRLQQLSSSIA